MSFQKTYEFIYWGGGGGGNIVYSVRNNKLDKNVKINIKQCIANKWYADTCKCLY